MQMTKTNTKSIGWTKEKITNAIAKSKHTQGNRNQYNSLWHRYLPSHGRSHWFNPSIAHKELRDA
jgi:hypothetical protein